MKGLLVSVTSLLFSSLVMAAPATVSEVVYKQQGGSYHQYRLPWVTQKDNPSSAKRINDFMFSRFVQALPGSDPQATLNHIGKSGIEQTANLDFELINSSANILTINTMVEGCGAYCETYNIYISFDLANGTNIDLDDILSPRAISLLNQKVREDIRHQITAFIAKQQTLPMAQRTKNDDEYVDYQQFYAGCWAMTMDDINYVSQFSLEKGKLVFSNGRCSNHASRALDELGEFTTKIAITEVADQLTPYGKNLFSDHAEPGISPKAKLSGRTLYGILGDNMPIVISVTCSHHYIEGAYFYAKYGSAIPLSGKCQDDNRSYTMTSTSDDATLERIELTLKNDKYQGTWESNGKRLPIVIDLP